MNIPCPHCQSPTSEPFRFEKNVPWSPSVHFCSHCDIKIFSWNIYSQEHQIGKTVLPLNEFQFKHLIEDFETIPCGYVREEPLVISASSYKEYQRLYELEEGLDLIRRIYEHQQSMRTGAFN